MHKQRTVFVLAAAFLALAAVTVALAATLVMDDDDSPEPSSSNIVKFRPATEAEQAAPSPTVELEQPEDIPDDVWAELQGLPDKLRDDLLTRFETGFLAVPEIEGIIEQYEDRNQSVRVGTVVEATADMLRIEIPATGERAEVALDDETVMRRGNDDIAASELEPDELLLVISRDGGETAFSVTAFGVGAP